ncbi:MAG: MBL fold metallo-hydrolase [Rhodospirillaceae bacterium]|nr:MBL fold metallo-hydrolase [Rhodospirillaceae bacterium]
MAEPAEKLTPADKDLKITFLGCGGAGGVPSVSAGWGACNPDNLRNCRRRASILVETATTRILIDASPDLRSQCLDAEIQTLDAVLFTHGHADHTNGLDELREVNRVLGGPLDIWADVDTMKGLETRFGYAFEGIAPGQPIFRPWLTPNIIDAPIPFTAGDMMITPFIQDHGVMNTLGFRIGDLAYSTDLMALPEAAIAKLQDLDVWIIGALTDKRVHPTHVSLSQAFEWIDELKPKRAIITHMGPSLDYDAVLEKCPAEVTPAHDGMVVKL